MAGSVIHALEDLVPFAEAPVIHIYEHPVDGGIVECMAVLVLKRDHGVLLAIPAGVVSQLELDEGQTATMTADLGPSALVEVGGARLSGTGAVSIPDSLMQVVLLDVGATAAVGRLSLLAQGMEPELLIPFDNGQPDLIPDPDALLARALLWAQGADPGQDRLAFYSATEEEPVAPKRAVLRLDREPPKATAPRQAGLGSATSTEGAGPPKPKRPTTSALASQLELIAQSLPEITQRLASLENRVALGPVGPLAQPLGQPSGIPAPPEPPTSQLLGAVPKANHRPMQILSAVGPPPATRLANQKAQLPVAAGQAEVDMEEMAADIEGPSQDSSLAQAVLAQSKALTALVGQLTHSPDPVLDLGSNTVSTRGAAQRARLQEDLSSGKGAFYQAVLQNMARRMNPSSMPESDPGLLLQSGVCLSRYWERFGGWSGQRDLALIAHQVAMALDACQSNRMTLVQDHLALLAVFLEQTALDGGRTDLAFHLTFLEEPPSSLFLARHPQGMLRTRAFAPLAAQRWVTVVLGFLRELETIQNRRTELTRAPVKASPSGSGAGSEEQQDSPRRRRPPKKKASAPS